VGVRGRLTARRLPARPATAVGPVRPTARLPCPAGDSSGRARSLRRRSFRGVSPGRSPGAPCGRVAITS